MIKNEAVAIEINRLMFELNAKMDESIHFVKEKCDEEDFKAYRRAAGKVMGALLIDVLYPLYEDNPALRPDWLSSNQS